MSCQPGTQERGCTRLTLGFGFTISTFPAHLFWKHYLCPFFTEDNEGKGSNKFQNTITVRVSGYNGCETEEDIRESGCLFFSKWADRTL